MPYLKILPDNSIADITKDDPGGGVFISEADMVPIIENKYGHAMFNYQGGAVIHVLAREEAFELARDKEEYINALVNTEMKLMARERLAPIISTIKAVTNRIALEALK